MKKMILFFIFGFVLTACFSKAEELKQNMSSSYYVSDSYFKKNEGYDWVSISLKQINDFEIKVSVRSRADKKKPTCTFDDILHKRENNIYASYKEGKTILFKISDNSLSIEGGSAEDENILYYFCSGGATLKGEYKKLEGEIDKKQIDKTIYINSLTYNGFRFLIEQKANKVSIFSPNLKYGKESIINKIEGNIVFSEIADLNADGSPEVYMYIENQKENRVYSSLLAYSVNNGLSMSEIYLAPLSHDKKAFDKYEGNDEFRVVENTLIRRFPIKDNKTKQIQYKLVAGEATWQLKIDKVMEY